MKALILVGGEGTRLRPLTLNCLKATVPMAGRPFLEYPLAHLKRHGIREVVFSICHLPEKIKQSFGSGRRYGMRFHYAVERAPLGTAGAIKNAAAWLGGGREPFVVLNGDVLQEIDLGKMLAMHKKNRALLSLALAWAEDPSAYGLVLTKRSGQIERFLEKPGAAEISTHWINAGVYLMQPAVLDDIPAGQNYSSERALFPALLARGERLWAFPSRGYWMDIGTAAKYHQAHHDILEGRLTMLPVGSAWRKNSRVRLGRRCRMHPSAQIFAPAIVGDGCHIEAEAVVTELCALGRGVQVAKRARIEQSVVWDNTRIEEGAQLSQCVVGRDCQIGKYARLTPGTVLGDGAVIPAYSQA